MEKTIEQQTIHDAKNAAALLRTENELKAETLLETARASANEIKKVLDAHRDDTQMQLVAALKTVVEGGDENQKILLLQRVPIICIDIAEIKKAQATNTITVNVMAEKQEWIQRGIIAIFGGVGLLFLTLVGSLLLNHTMVK